MEARTSDQTLGKCNYLLSRADCISWEGFYQCVEAQMHISGIKRKRIYEAHFPSFLVGGALLFAEDLVFRCIPALKGKEENYIRNLCMLK